MRPWRFSTCLLFVGLVVLSDVTAANGSQPESHPTASDQRDSDRDGLPDALERRTGTRPLRADTDGDGIPDGLEDLDHDGRVDPGESDPRVSGLFPGRYPHIPEPMVFDLVRGLGARADEVEVNTLAIMSPRNGRPQLAWAPEIEWAFSNNVAAELELPMTNRELEALKVAVQATPPQPNADIMHGVQVIGEYLLSHNDIRAVALYIAGGRIGGWSFLGMTGGRATGPRWSRASQDVVVGPSVFLDLGERVTVGLENNLAINRAGRHQLSSLPQVHWQISRRVRLQFGGGVARDAGRTHAVASTRVILE